MSHMYDGTRLGQTPKPSRWRSLKFVPIVQETIDWPLEYEGTGEVDNLFDGAG